MINLCRNSLSEKFDLILGTTKSIALSTGVTIRRVKGCTLDLIAVVEEYRVF
jgi:hypothetical protein